ncbi:HopJ type III effector protein [Thiomicrorhabdus sp.]|uniref:HopJ type III effector protein n=1 Tax=Thiomicrorhabdus sp. TaxID=2039724 RepID=UPI0029C74050|nr:HopJ type III effector protein [Thiomicrorhabdus sp.]
MSTIHNSQELIAALKDAPVDFKTVMQVIDSEYEFAPTAFKNGETFNEAGSNNGSCKVFAFGELHQLSEQQTLNAFGDFYCQDVLQHPENEDHQNIRNFMSYGWKGIEFSGTALVKKE